MAHGPHQENARTSFSFLEPVDAAYPGVNNFPLGGLDREGRSSVNFTALVVEDDTLQRETLADLLKDQGLEVIECKSAEAAELVVASTGSELKALVRTYPCRARCRASNWPNMPSASFRISTSSWSPVARRPTFRKMLLFC
jgi:hypothetical protein